jgi:hypothetical protein
MNFQRDNSALRQSTASELSIAEAQTIDKLNAAAEGFHLEEFRDQYLAAQKSICSSEGQLHLQRTCAEISAVLEKYLEIRKTELSDLKIDGIFSIEAATTTAALLTELYVYYSVIKEWPSRFQPLKEQFRNVAEVGFQSLEKELKRSGQDLKSDFQMIAKNYWDTYEQLMNGAQSAAVVSQIGEISKAIVDAINASLKIEGVCGWRLGKRNRYPYRELADRIKTDFGIVTNLPQLQPDPGHIPVGRNIPRKW